MPEPRSANKTEDPRVEARTTRPESPLTTNDQRKIDIAQCNAASSPLLRLPPEIRNMIYTLIIDVNTVVFTKAGLGRGRHPIQDGLALLRVCRQIHVEAALLPYALNTFVFWTFTSDLQAFLYGRKKEQIAAMRKVQWGSGGPTTAVEWIKILWKLERGSSRVGW